MPMGMTDSSAAVTRIPDADAVVVGAGHNGLVAANLLADAGWSVLVVEAADHPGGAVWSDEVVRPGFVTDLYSAFYPLGAASPVIAGLGLEDFGLQWRHAPTVLAHVLPDDSCAVLHRDAERTAKSVAAFADEDGPAWLEMTDEYRRLRDPLIAALFQPFPPVRNAMQLLRRLGVGDAMRFARFVVQPVRRFTQEKFVGAGAPLLLAGNALHTDLSPDSAGGAVYGWLLAMLGQDVGFPVPVGGARILIDALAARLRARGGGVLVNAPVTEIVVANGCARGVRLASGEVIRARAVLADVAAPALYRDLVGSEHLPPTLVRDLDSFEWDGGTVKLNWALSEPIPWTAADARDAGTVHVGVDMDGLIRFSADLAQRRMPREPFLVVGQMTTTDPTRSPAGTESAWCYTHLPPGQHWSADDVAAHVERIEQVMERHAPGFGARVLGRTVQSPLDLEQHDANLVGGAVNAGTASVHQQLFFRPVPGLGRAETVVDGLYLASASAHPGGGVHGAPGANAARAALRRAGRAGAVHRKMIDLAHARVYPSGGHR